MAIRLTNGAEFLHIPKTGGRWVTETMRSLGYVREGFGKRHADFDRVVDWERHGTGSELLRLSARLALRRVGLAKEAPARPFRFTFVRHPLRWYESYFRYMSGRKWNDWGEAATAEKWHPNSVLNGLPHQDFNTFMQSVVKVRPGYATELFFSYTKRGIDFIGRTENLRSDLASVLELLGYEPDREHLESAKRVNSSRVPKEVIQWDPGLRELVTRLELPALVHFGYLSAEERSRLGVSEWLGASPALAPEQQVTTG